MKTVNPDIERAVKIDAMDPDAEAFIVDEGAPDAFGSTMRR